MTKFLLPLVCFFCSNLAFGQESSLVKVKVFQQHVDERSPWSQQAIKESGYVGVVLDKDRILISAQAIVASRYIEVESLHSSIAIPAKVDRVDYNAQLAILRLESSLRKSKPIKMGKDLKINANISILSLKEKRVVPIRARFRELKIRTSITANYNLPHYTFEIKRKGVGWSEPVMNGESLAGLATRKEKNQIFAIPVSVIRRFLDGEGRDSSFGRLGFSYSPLKSQLLRRDLGLESVDRGVWVNKVSSSSPVASILRPGDVLLAVGAYEIQSDGLTKHHLWGTIPLSGIVYTFPVGKPAKLKFLRDGKIYEKSLEMIPHNSEEDFVPFYSSSRRPFTIYSGLVLIELSRNYLQSWGEAWLRRSPIALLKRFIYDNSVVKEKDERVLVLAKVLPDKINKGYEGMKNAEIYTLNGVAVRNLDHALTLLRKPLKKNSKSFTRMTLGPLPGEIILDHSGFADANKRVAKLYSISEKFLWKN